MVGQVMLKVLEERNLPITELIPVASEKSVGRKSLSRVNSMTSFLWKLRFL